MENDIVFRAITQLQYPVLYRHDRSIYKSHPEVDPLRLAQRCVAAAFAGYWVGKLYKRREIAFACAFAVPFVAVFLYDEWKLAEASKKYESFAVDHQNEDPLKARRSDLAVRKGDKQGSSSLKPIRPFPKLQRKIYCAADFISKLDDSYFQS